MQANQLKQLLRDGALNPYRDLYTDPDRQAARMIAAIDAFTAKYGENRDISLFSVPGRSEICGNHTDHNHGCVLAAAIEPDASARELATMLTASMDTNDFFTEAHPKLRPVESPTAGIFLSGTCQGPKDIPETVAQAGAAAAKVIGLLSKDRLTCNPCVAQPDELMCNGCSSCEKVCPYGAITYVDKEFRGPNRTTLLRRVAQVNPAVCQGCGACTVACPSGAMDLKGFSNKQIMAEVDAICR